MLRERLTDLPPASTYPRLDDRLALDSAAADAHHEAMQAWMDRITESIQGVLLARERRFEEVKRALSRLESGL